MILNMVVFQYCEMIQDSKRWKADKVNLISKINSVPLCRYRAEGLITTILRHSMVTNLCSPYVLRDQWQE
jgi:hypothetical protein